MLKQIETADASRKTTKLTRHGQGTDKCGVYSDEPWHGQVTADTRIGHGAVVMCVRALTRARRTLLTGARDARTIRVQRGARGYPTPNRRAECSAFGRTHHRCNPSAPVHLCRRTANVPVSFSIRVHVVTSSRSKRRFSSFPPFSPACCVRFDQSNDRSANT
jgi:hypothetical protein